MGQAPDAAVSRSRGITAVDEIRTETAGRVGRKAPGRLLIVSGTFICYYQYQGRF